MALGVRPLTAEEETELRRRAAARTVPARTVERAKLIWLLHEGERVPAVAKRLGLGADVVRGWLKRFNAEGLEGLKDRPRAGRSIPPGRLPDCRHGWLQEEPVDPHHRLEDAGAEGGPG